MNETESRLTRWWRWVSPARVSTGLSIPALDGVRGLAVLLVVLDHAHDNKLISGMFVDSAGRYGVLLFFALSAFLLTFPFCAYANDQLVAARTWLNYGARRFLRVYPPFVVCVLFSAWEGDIPDASVWNHLWLADGQKHLWTIPVEVKYYLFIPCLVLAWAGIRSPRSMRGLVIAVLAVVVGIIFLQWIDPAWSAEEKIELGPYFRLFLLGSVAGAIHFWLRAWDERMPEAGRWLLEAMGWFMLGWLLMRIPGVHMVFREGESEHSVREDVETCSILIPLFLIGMIHGKGYLARVFALAPLRYIGLVSYSAYLWHRLVFEQAVDLETLSGPMRAAVGLGGVLLVATVSYFVMEKPLAALGRRLKH